LAKPPQMKKPSLCEHNENIMSVINNCDIIYKLTVEVQGEFVEHPARWFLAHILVNNLNSEKTSFLYIYKKSWKHSDTHSNKDKE
jgi:hypothetical protein